MLLMITACNTLKQDARKLDGINRRNPILIAQNCDDKFKDVDSVREVIKYIPGETIFKQNTVRLNIDSLIRTLPPRIDSVKDTLFMDVICPPSLIRIDTIHSDKSITSTHKANVFILEHYTDSLQLVILQLKEDVIRKNKKIVNKNRTIGVSFALIGIFILFQMFKIYTKVTKII